MDASGGPSFHPKYRPDIDGLRGVAVLSVIGFHVFPSWVRGGFVGVDVFFVVSGYLITSIIIGGLAEQRFSFAGFYARRIRRIFPALIAVLAACYVYGWFNLYADDYEQLAKHIAGGAGFVSNVVLWNDAGYFDIAGARKPLLHLWSLGIEEQFYLVWPLLLWAAWKRRLNPFWPTLVILGASLVTGVFVVRRDPIAAFYSPVTRFWELLMGAMLAHARVDVARAWTHVAPRARHVGSAAGMALILASVAFLDQTRIFPGLWALVPTGGAALLIATGPDAWANRRVLSRGGLVWVGLISYPLYLWHWPLLSFAHIAQGQSPTRATPIIVVAVSALLAWLTYRLIERPIRYGWLRSRAVPALCTAMVVVFGVALFTFQSGGLVDRAVNRSDEAHFIQYYERLHKKGLRAAYWDACDFLDWTTESTKTALDPECTKAGVRGTVLLWGDSYAQALSYGLKDALASQVRLAQVTASGCPPRLPDVDVNDRDICARANTRALAAVRELKPDLVVLAQMTGHGATNWIDMADRLRTLGAAKVVLVGPSPQWHPSLPFVVVKNHWGRDYRRVSDGLDPSVFQVDAALKVQYGHAPQLTYASIVEQLCDTGGCLAAVPGGSPQDLIAVDSGHLTPRGSTFVVEQVLGPYLPGR